MKTPIRSFATLIIGLGMALSSCQECPAQTPAPPAPSPTAGVPPGFEQATNQVAAIGPFNAVLSILPSWDATATNTFSAKEFALESAPLWKTATASGSTPYNSTEGDYFFTRNLGAGAEIISLGNGTGTSTVDSGNMVLTLRKDIGNIAGYLLLSGGYDFNQKRMEGGFGPGLVFGYKTHIRLFTDTRLQYEGSEHTSKAGVKTGGNGFLTRVGIQIPF